MLKGLGALGDMTKMMKAAQEMQGKLAALQEELGRKVVLGEAGGGAVKFMKDYEAAGLKKSVPLVASGFLTEGTVAAAGSAGQGLVTAMHYADSMETPRNSAFRNKYAVTYKSNPDVYAVQGYDAAQLLAVGLAAVKGDAGKKAELQAAMNKATIDSPRGKFTLSPQRNPTQDFYVREVKGEYNVMSGVAVKALADPGRGCKL